MKKEPLAKLPISFHEKEHKYIWDPTGDVMAYSVTQICGFDITDRKRDNIEATKHIWEPRGHTVHHCLEQYLLGEAQPDPGDYADWVEPLINHPFFTDFEPIAVEYRMCDLRRNIGGSLDALGFYKGKTLLVDLKTQSKVQSQIYSTDRQMGGYISMLCDHHPNIWLDECRTVWAKPGKTTIGKAQNPALCCCAFQDAWDMFRRFRPDF